MSYAFVQDVPATWDTYREHRGNALNWTDPEGLVVHAAGPTDEGFRMIGIWDSRETCDRFRDEHLSKILDVPHLGNPNSTHLPRTRDRASHHHRIRRKSMTTRSQIAQARMRTPMTLLTGTFFCLLLLAGCGGNTDKQPTGVGDEFAEQGARGVRGGAQRQARLAALPRAQLRSV